MLRLGASPNDVPQPQKIFVACASWQCTSSPTTISHARQIDRALMRAPPRRAHLRARTPRGTSCASSKCAAISCPPTGNPSTRPIGCDMAGMPARLAVAVKMSLRYISYGSDTAPSVNAVVGVVGVKQHVHADAKTCAKSSRDQGAHRLRAFVVRVVVAGAQHIRAQQDAARDFGAEAAGARGLVHAAQPVARATHAVPHAIEAREIARRLGRRDDVVHRNRQVRVRQRYVAHFGAARAQSLERRDRTARECAGRASRGSTRADVRSRRLRAMTRRDCRRDSRRPARSADVASCGSAPDDHLQHASAASSTVRPNTPM